MKTLLLISVLSLSACSTTPNGQKVFLGLNARQWTTLGVNSGKQLVPIVKSEYDIATKSNK